MWSKVRDKIVGDGKPRVSGHIAYRAVLKRDEVPEDLWQPDVILWAGPRTHLVHYPLRRGELYNLVAVFHSERYVEGWNAEADAGELWAHFNGQRPEVMRMLERIETWRMWVLCDREPVKDWSKGRVTLLGRRRPSDAAISRAGRLHGDRGCGTARRRGRGAAATICRPPSAPMSQQRYLRTARVQIMARVYGDFYHARGPAAELRNQMLGARTPEQSYEGIVLALRRDVRRRPGSVLLQPGDRARLAGHFQNVHAGIGAIDHIDVAAVVGLQIVALDRDLAAVLAVDLDAALLGRLGDRRNEIADLLRTVRIADIDRAHAGIEPGHERELLVEHRRRALVRRSARRSGRRGCRNCRPPRGTLKFDTTIGSRLRSSRRRTTPSGAFRGLAFVDERLVDDHDHVAHCAGHVLGEFARSSSCRAEWSCARR